MPPYRFYKWLLIILCGIAIVVVILVPAFFHFLPIYLQTRLIPRLSLEAGLDPREIHIRRIGWRGADLGPMRLGFSGQTLLKVAAVQLDYSLVSLLRGRIDTVVISGVRIDVTLNAEGTGIAGLTDSQIAPTQTEQRPADTDLEKKLPISIGRLVIPDGRLNAHWKAHSVSVPFEMDLSTAAPEGAAMENHKALESITGTLRVGPDTNALHAWGTLNLRTRRMALSLTGQDLDPSGLHAFLQSTPLNRISARIDLQAELQGRLEPFELTSLLLESRVEGLELTSPDFALQNTLDDRNRPIPIVARLTMQNQGPWQWSVAPFEINRPAGVHVTQLDGAVTLVEKGWRSETRALSIVPAQPLDPSSDPAVALRQPLAMLWRLTARSPDGTSIEFEIDGSGRPGDPKQNPLAIQIGDVVADSAPPNLSVAGTYDGRAVKARFEGRLANLHLSSAGFTAHVPDSLLTGTLESNQALRIEATAKLPHVRIAQGTITARLARTRLDARLIHEDGLRWTLAGELNLPEADINDSAHGVKVLGLSARLPLKWPLDTQTPAGELKAGPIGWQAHNLGDIEGRMGLLPQGFFAKATHRSKLFPGLNVLLDTRIANGETIASVTVAEYTPAAEIDLGRFYEAATGFRVNGRIAAQVDLIVKGTTVDAQGGIKIDQGTVRHPDSSLSLNGIAVELRMPDLLSLRSAPAQQLRIASMTFGKINATDLQIDFQLEPSNTLFVEHAGLRWSQGTLQTQAFRLKPELDDVMVTLYCDRLNLAMVLDQLGVARASGDGAVNGRIPMRWRKGQLSFDNGFLYSTPGQTGTIALQGTDFLLEGLPAGSPQHTQLDIATEALKDYTYQWATLRMETRNTDLVLGLQLDGKPNRLLPFAYDPQSGGFVRYKGEGQAEFKGIRIDLNFTTPLNEILDYRSLLTPTSR
jgi:hypothetical protein